MRTSRLAALFLVALGGCGELVGPHPSTYGFAIARVVRIVIDDVYTLGNSSLVEVDVELLNAGATPLLVAHCETEIGDLPVGQLVVASQLTTVRENGVASLCPEPTFQQLLPADRIEGRFLFTGSNVPTGAPFERVHVVFFTPRGLLVSDPVEGLQ
jgi:hypothetical protein